MVPATRHAAGSGGLGALPPCEGDVELRAQRPPHLARLDSALDSLSSCLSTECSKDVIFNQHVAPRLPELGEDQLAKLCQTHEDTVGAVGVLRTIGTRPVAVIRMSYLDAAFRHTVTGSECT